MEVRGGCGYIEEWSDARLLRDAHLGSIWEGTSNIVAQDVIRAINREDSLTVLREHLASLLKQTRIHAAAHAKLCALVDSACSLAGKAASNGADQLARQAASGLYHAASAVAMAWEACQTGSARRMVLAQMVMMHRLMPRDPLAPDSDAGLQFLFDDSAIAQDIRDINLVDA
jgi:acyl-CoA dehydrogenase